MRFVIAEEPRPWDISAMTDSVNHAANLKSPRVIKSHLPFEMLPPNLLDTCKVIFVSRNPKDCCVSYYHHYGNFPGYAWNGNFQDFAKMFIEGKTEYGGYWTMLKVYMKYNQLLLLIGFSIATKRWR